MTALGPLRRQLRDARRQGGLEPLPIAAARPSHVDVDGDLDVGAGLADARAASPRLHASLRALDPAQQRAVLADDRAALVRAQVGSGKTTVLIHKVLYLHLVRAVPLDEIAVLTFTAKAADELRARLEELAARAVAPDERWLMGTFHGVAATLLRRALPVEQLGYRPDFAVLDEDQHDALLAALIRQHRLRLRPRRRLRERLRALAAGADPGADDLARLAGLARDQRRAQNAMDFDDLIDHASTLLAQAGPRRPRWLLVDEMQDCEPRELELVRRLRGPATSFFGVGDPLQSIYGWRGGAPALFARAEAELGCRPYQLPISYRSTRTILDGARAVLGPQPIGAGALVAARDHGARIAVRRHHDPLGEAVYLAARLAELHGDGVPRRELAVLCRLRAQVDALAAMLAARGVPCALDAEAAPDAVRVLTLHAAKGLEFRHVFIAGANVGIVPLALPDQRTDDAEERRLLFVGLTRARDSVEVSYCANPHQFGALGVASPLLRLLPAAVVDWQDGTAPPVAPAAAAAPWHVGQAVRHPRYGAGVVVAVASATIDCAFGKLGPRSFPLRLCPLTAAAAP